MPSNRKPSTIQRQSGRAPQDSVTAIAIVEADDLGGSIQITAAQVTLDPPLALAGDTVQAHANVVADLAPTPPNVLGAVSNPLNPVNLAESPALVSGFEGDPAVAVQVLPSTPVTFTGILFPSDRGVLVAQVDTGSGYTAVTALDLSVIFTEGLPEATVAPARVVGQLDYSAGANPSATLDALPQGVSLIDRLPRSDDYDRADYPFLPAGDDPVYQEYAEAFGGQQLSKFTWQVPLPISQVLSLRLMHFKDVEAYEKSKVGGIAPTYGEVVISTSLYVDTSGTPVSIGAFAYAPTNTLVSSELAINRRFLSGVHYYSENDTFNFSFTAFDLYDETFLNEGVVLESGHEKGLVYTLYSPTGTASAQPSSFSDPVFTINDWGVVSGTPRLIVKDPTGNTDNAISGADAVLHVATSAWSSSSLTREDFTNEIARYPSAFGLDPSNDILPDGVGSTWNPQDDISGTQDLQVRGMINGRLSVNAGSGELVYPQDDYTAGFFPTTRDGVAAQLDYSAASGVRYFIRSFEVGGPKLRGKIRLQGTFTVATSANLFDEFKAGSATGVKIKLSAPGQSSSAWLDLGTDYLESNGCLVGVEYESDNSIVCTYQLNQYPAFVGGHYPVAICVEIDGAGTSALSGEFGLQLLEYVPV